MTSSCHAAASTCWPRIGDLDLDRIGAPASLQALISARLDTLSNEQREVVNRASILGDSFRAEEIAALCPDLTDIDRVLRELVRLQILSVTTSRLSSEYGYFSFVQSVVRQVASAMLSRRDRKATHLAVLELLLAEHDPVGDLAPIIAQHYLDALAALPSDPDAEALRRSAIAQLERAANRAGALGSPAEAAGHLSAALAQATDDATRARLQGDLAWSLMHAGEYGEALPHAAEATRIFDELGDPVAAGLAAAAHAQILGYDGDNEGALAVAQPRWAQLEGRRDADRTMMALGEALISGSSRLSRDFREIAEKRLGIAERNGAYDVIADSMLALGVHYSNVGLTSLFRALQKAGADMARTQRRPTVLARALVNLTSDAINDELDEAVAYGQEALSVASGAGVALWISFARINLAIALLERGDWADLDALLALETQEAVHAGNLPGHEDRDGRGAWRRVGGPLDRSRPAEARRPCAHRLAGALRGTVCLRRRTAGRCGRARDGSRRPDLRGRGIVGRPAAHLDRRSRAGRRGG